MDIENYDNKVVNGNPPAGVDYRVAYFNNKKVDNWAGIKKVAFGEKLSLIHIYYRMEISISCYHNR